VLWFGGRFAMVVSRWLERMLVNQPAKQRLEIVAKVVPVCNNFGKAIHHSTPVRGKMSGRGWE
jgi:hypothetical protein